MRGFPDQWLWLSEKLKPVWGRAPEYESPPTAQKKANQPCGDSENFDFRFVRIQPFAATGGSPSVSDATKECPRSGSVWSAQAKLGLALAYTQSHVAKYGAEIGLAKAVRIAFTASLRLRLWRAG